MSTFKITPLI